MLILQNDAMEKIRFYAQKEYPKECCGIMLGRRFGEQRIVYKVIPTRNMMDERRITTCFLINPLEIVKAELQAEEKKHEIIGFYHSHTDYEAVTSSADVNQMIAGYSYPIVSVKNGICDQVRSFEKRIQTDTDAEEEKILVKEK
ncbi:MAG: M67 family metallopeptidase [Lachnospiraceae bacterium]|nr:M67 family metallopeptidase [Lachnospiraceae bacterium]